jgi:hypothetical protein
MSRCVKMAQTTASNWPKINTGFVMPKTQDVDNMEVTESLTVGNNIAIYNNVTGVVPGTQGGNKMTRRELQDAFIEARNTAIDAYEAYRKSDRTEEDQRVWEAADRKYRFAKLDYSDFLNSEAN